MLSEEMKSEVRRIVPVLSEERYKGQSGKVAILGGCREYTGAPYFAAFAALRVGADLSHVFCTSNAATVIKSYSPEIIVHPYLSESTDFKEVGGLTDARRAVLVEEAASEVESWFSRLDCLVVGPGLGRDPLLLDTAKAVIQKARRNGLPLVLDGDGLFLVAREPELIIGYNRCVLTPNLNEFRRLSTVLGVTLHGPNNDRSSKLAEVTSILAGPTMVSKGPVDALCDGKNTIMCNAMGASKRCGGQGDLLAGIIATFVAWTLSFMESAKRSDEAVVMPEINPMILAAYGGCLVTRTASAYAFGQRKRSMVAGDVIESIGQAVELLFDHSAMQAGTAPENVQTPLY